MKNGDLLQDAMGMIDDIYIGEVTDLCPPHTSGRHRLFRLLSLAACFCLIICLGIGIMSASHDIKKGVYPTVDLPPVDMDQIVWAKNTGTMSESVETAVSDSMASMHWEGWEMSGDLYLALKEADDETYIAILVRRGYDYNAMMNFSYLGKTRGQWQVEWEILNTQQRKLGEFSKEGQWLKYGEQLYTTGTPDGERWTRELYESRVDFYGEYFIEQYVQNGELLTEKIEQEMAANEIRLRDISLILVDLNDAYIAQSAQEDYPKFAEKQIHYAIQNGSLYLFVRKKDLSKLDIRKKSNYTLSLANRNVFTEKPITVDDTITGFNCSKITFYTDGVRYNTVSDDAQVIEATRYLLERWQYTGDTLSVSLYCEPQLTEEELAAMNYDSIYLSKHSKLVYMTIKMERFDLEAVRDLSLLPQVTSIHIGPHMLAYSLG